MIVTVTGRNGFIGSALTKKLEQGGVTVSPRLREDAICVFLFGSPSSNILFNQDLYGSTQDTINTFLHAIEFCKQHKIKLIYPSSATIYQKSNNYAHIKAALEEIQAAYNTDVLGLRIAAGYGPGEGHKQDYSSVIYQFCQQMKAGKRPIIYGDGTQTRDFVFIDDIIETIVTNLEAVGQIDIRTGVETSFNTIVDLINQELGTNIKPKYVKAGKNYVTSTVGGEPISSHISIENGIKIILNEQVHNNNINK